MPEADVTRRGEHGLFGVGTQRKLFAILILALGWGLGPLATALTPDQAVAQSLMSGGTISEIRVEGTQRIEPETVRSYLRLNPGDPFDPRPHRPVAEVDLRHRALCGRYPAA